MLPARGGGRAWEAHGCTLASPLLGLPPLPGTPSWQGEWALATALAVPAKWLEKDLDCTVRGRILPEAKLS